MLELQNPYCSTKKHAHVNDNLQQPKICELLDVQTEIDSLYNNTKILISNNENIHSPIFSKLS